MPLYQTSETEPPADLPGVYRLVLSSRADNGFIALITPAITPTPDMTPLTMGANFALFRALPGTGSREVWTPAIGAIVITGRAPQVHQDDFWERVTAEAEDSVPFLGPLLNSVRLFLSEAIPGLTRVCWFAPTDLRQGYILTLQLDHAVLSRADGQLEMTDLVKRLIAWWRTELLADANDSGPRAAYIREASPDHLGVLVPFAGRANQLLPQPS